MTGLARLTAALVAVLALAACSEAPQELGAKGSQPSWQGTGNGHAVDGWKAGDQASWEEQMRRRAEHQNEYARISGAS